MKTSLVLQGHGVLKSLGQKATPLKLTITRCTKLTGPIVSKFNENKENKFNELVLLDESGAPVITKEVKDALDSGKLNPNQGIPMAAHEFQSKTGSKELNDYLGSLQEEELDIEFPSVSLTKLIRVKKDEKETELVPLSDLLEAPDSEINSDALGVLMELGIIVD